ncbi:Rv2175c family DNA-binding protein [Pseudactinotalea suaedae]|jgi:hypothetical protein|uniref:Rv2175c family DNA-binding protein n=1 Tax=Pseudactinotalea suaedae TaxID=1524924 RepID=UPI0012E17CD6|nr:Rv2175c family DNA-binding protein [Pseudactinotalea suaedae]
MTDAVPSTEEQDPLENIELLSIPEVAQALGVRDREVRGMISDKSVVAVRRGGRAPTIPSAFVVDDPETGGKGIVSGLRGSIIQLSDAGYADEEIVAWLFRDNEELGSTPIEALVGLRTHAVRRAAQVLAF